MAIGEHDKLVLDIFFTAHAQKRLFRSFQTKSYLDIRFGDPDFLLQGNNSYVGIHFRYFFSAHAQKYR